MKKIIGLTLFLLVFFSANSFAMYIEVVPTSEIINQGGSNFIGMYYQWDSNSNAAFDDGDHKSYYNGTADYYYQYAYAGQFHLTFKENENSDPLYSSFGFCIDLLTNSGSGTGTLETITTDELKQASWLVNTFWSSQNSAEQNAGLQMAIWDVLYSDLSPTNDFDRFQPFDYMADLGYKEYAYHQDYMNALGNAALTDFDYSKFRVVNFDGDELQNMLTTIPEPATLILLGFGLLGLSGLGRKKS